MAATRVSERCLVCNIAILSDQLALFVGMVRPTSSGSYSLREPNPGQLRVRFVSGGKPKGLIHRQCFHNLMERLPW